MNVPKSILPLLVLAPLFGSCHSSGWGSKVRGEGPHIHTDRELASFDRVSLAGGMKLDVVVGEPQSVMIYADSNLHEYIRTRIDGSTLEIEFTESISTSNELRAKIKVPSLTGIEVAGSAEMRVTHIDAEDFYIEIAGSATGVLEGTTKDLDVDIMGSGNLDLFGLSAAVVKVDIAGSGNLKVHARDTLDVDIAGGGSVTYRGEPDISLDQMGSASVRAEKPRSESF